VLTFKEWLEAEEAKPSIIYLDLDHTLVFVTDEGVVKTRPHLHDFIKEMEKIAPTRVLTHGPTWYQKNVCDVADINVPVIGKDQYDKAQKSPNAVLVDDRPPTHEFTQIKMHHAGIDKDRVITIKKWDGETHDDELKRVADVVKNMDRKDEWVISEAVEKNPQKVPAKQPFKTYKKAKSMAEDRERVLKRGMKEAAGDHKVVVNIKSKDSFRDKTVERGKKPEKVGDVLRGAIIVNSKSQIKGVVDKLRKIFIIKKIDHKTKPDDEFGYYGATHVDVVVDGMICEIQVLTKKLWDVKFDHYKIYRRYRSKDEVPQHIIDKSREMFKKANS
jgi:hypothetical protein